MTNFLKKFIEDKSIPQEVKTQIINEAFETYRSQQDQQYQDYRNRQILGGALEIGSALPMGGIGAQGAKLGAKALTKYLGKNISKGIGSGLFSGAVGGGIWGTGDGIVNNQNPITSAIDNAVTGAVSGGILGGGLGKIQQIKRTGELSELLDKRKDWGIAYTKASHDPAKAIEILQENQKGFVPNAFSINGVNYDIPWGVQNPKKIHKGYGLKHIIEARKDQGINTDEFLKGLPEVLKNEPNRTSAGRKIIETDDDRVILGTNWNGKDRNYLHTAYPKYESVDKRPMSFSPLEDVTSGNGSISIPELTTDKGNINSFPNFVNGNLGKINEDLQSTIFSKDSNYAQAGSFGQAIANNVVQNLWNLKPHNNVQSQGNPTLYGHVEKNDFSKIPIADPIKNPSEPTQPTGFGANIKEDKNSFDSLFRGYKNPYSGDNRIYSREEIGEMTNDEYSKKEKDIFAQLNSVGIPYKQDLHRNSIGLNSNTVYIAPYTRSDGVQVKGHYRSVTR